MDYKIHWLRSATEDFRSIFLYYSTVGGERVAKKRLSKILQATSYLETMSYMGKQDDDLKKISGYRYIVVMTYRIYYFVEDDNVYIASIWDYRRDVKEV